MGFGQDLGFVGGARGGLMVSALVSGFEPWPGTLCCVLGQDTVPLSTQGWVVRKPVNANPGLKVNPGNNFSSMKMLSNAYVL